MDKQVLFNKEIRQFLETTVERASDGYHWTLAISLLSLLDEVDKEKDKIEYRTKKYDELLKLYEGWVEKEPGLDVVGEETLLLLDYYG